MADVKMPQLGEAVTEGTIIRWLKSEGDFVTQDEPLFEVSTDKVDSEVPSPASGVIERIIFPEGATVDVGMTLAVIGQRDVLPQSIEGSASETNSLASIRDLAAITATLGLAAHTDQITIDPEMVAEDKSSEAIEEAPLLPPVDYNGNIDIAQDDTVNAGVTSMDQAGSQSPSMEAEQSYSIDQMAAYEVEAPSVDYSDEGQQDYTYTHPDAYLAAGSDSALEESNVNDGMTEELSRPDAVLEEEVSSQTDNFVISPLIRRMAEENNLDLDAIYGSGPGGRVTREDLMSHIGQEKADWSEPQEESAAEPVVDFATNGKSPNETDDFLEAEEIAAERLNVQPVETNVATGQDQVAVSQSAETASILGRLWNNLGDAQPVVETEVRTYRKGQDTLRTNVPAVQKNDERIPFTSMRRMTAEHMVRSKSISPHAFVAREVDFERVEQTRQLLNKPTNTLFDFHVTYLPFVLSALVNVVSKYPKMNASVGRDELIVHNYVNIGIVVDLEGDGMIVPVLRQADSMSLAELITATKKLVTKARSRSLGAEDVTDGTIAVSNQGAMGAALTFPIITQPQVAVLSIDTIKRKPTVVTVEGEEAIAVHSLGMLGLAFDARVIDTSYAAAFLRDLSMLLEERDFAKELGIS